MEEIVSLCKRRGFIYQGSEIYGGLAGTWDYGPLGVELKRNVMNAWWRFFVEQRDDMYGVDAAIIMNPKTWVASGHTATFSDPLVECKNCHSRFRADKIDLNDKCPVCGQKDWSEVRQFNMMFETNVGPVKDDKSTAYLRPETAQGIFTNYKNVLDSFYPDLPFGIAQTGKAFRNEISPRDFIFRSREFEQMEIEYFVDPEAWSENFDKLLADIYKFLDQMGIPKDKIHELEVPEADRAHYSKRTIDIEFDFPIGREELLGLAYRTDFDLQNIARESGKSMEYRPKDTSKQPFVPHVIEPSFGVERLIMAILTTAYTQDGDRTYLKLPKSIAPVEKVVSPLLKNKPELVSKACEVYDSLKTAGQKVMWDDSGNIGKRYAKADEIGVPECIVVDFTTLEDDTITIRDRDTTEQKRVKISEIS
ncbi:MAG: glycine--tRNA ligase [Candidatus Nomurabacteria bacterium]|jgi:glycyl-tRNA synthetase|nr:glycine--tRNA ligase [Candidatus Nomurabacteria bacterium]